MHRQLISRRPGGRRRDSEDGAIAIIVALTMTTLLVMAAMVLDFGLVRVDRQFDKSAADAATFSGLHGLNVSSDAQTYPYAGVCTALRYLQVNASRFSALTAAAGTWSNGTGGSQANGCTNAALLSQPCKAGDSTTWARFDWTGTYQGTALRVSIRSGYTLPDASFSEDNLPAALAFSDDSAQGCDQLAVIITQNRKPGLGSLATSSDLISTVRSVGRVKIVSGGFAPAMLLLQRSGCPILQSGSNSGGSHIYVYGSLASDGRTMPGSIHADSSGVSCSGGSGQSILLGKATNGIVAFAAPLPSNPSMPDASKPGMISTVAGTNGTSSNVISDGLSNVFGSSALDENSAASSAKAAAGGRKLVTRKPVDDRYLAAVQNVISASSSRWSLTAGNAASKGYSVVSSCSPPSIPNVAMVFVDCTANGGFKGPATFGSNTTEVVFNGSVKPSGTVSIPNAAKVYIAGAPGADAIALGNGNSISVHTSGNLNGGLCTNAMRSATNKATVVIKAGDLKETGGSLQLCNTTLIAMGNAADGCLGTVPAQQANGPTSTPCGGGSGDGQLAQTGGDVDWTAPNSIDIVTDSSSSPLASAVAGWNDPNGPEDLAYWSESYGGNSNPTYSMSGGGTLHVVGVYMIPNAQPFSIGGGATQVLSNAQYVAASIALNGNNTSIAMRVDANTAVTLPDLGLVGLVR